MDKKEMMKESKEHARCAIVVLGMHRSGTSALTRVLNLLGVDLGYHLMPPDKYNPSGYWEHQDVYLSNEALLSSLNSSWDDIRSLPGGWEKSDAAERYRLEIISILNRDFNGGLYWGIKDPRLCRLLPAWHSIFKSTNDQPFFIHIVRNPLEVVFSSAERNSFPKGKSCLLWLRHLLDAEKSTRNRYRLFVTYDQLLHDWKSVISRIEQTFGFTWEIGLEKVNREIQSFLQDGLRHSRINDTVLTNSGTLPNWIRDAYLAAKEASEGNEGELIKCMDLIGDELSQIESLYDPAFTCIWDNYLSNRKGLQEKALEIERLTATVSRLQQELGYGLATIENLEVSRKEKQDRIQSLERSVTDLDEHRASMEQSLAEREAGLESLRREVQAREICLTDKESEIIDLRQRLSVAQKSIAEKEDRLAELERSRTELEQSLANRNQEIESLYRDIHGRDVQLAENDREFISLRSSLAASRGEIAEHEWDLSKLRSEIKEKDSLLNKLRDESENFKNVISSLELEIERFSVDREVILSSTSWKITKPVRWIKLKGRGAGAIIKALPYFFKRQYWIIRRSQLFDRSYYLAQNPDVAAAGIDPLAHYLKFGAQEGRNPHSLFDSSYYLQHNPDVAEAGMNPLAHFIRFGASEGREPKSFDGQYSRLKLAPLFDAAYYLDQNPDVAKSGIDPLAHYLELGARMGMDPHPFFDSSYYLAHNPDAAEAGINPLLHFIEVGADEGRQPKPRLSLLLELEALRDSGAAEEINAAVRWIDKKTWKKCIADDLHIGHLVYDRLRLGKPEPDRLVTIDIIVTCHNAIDDLKACFHHLARTTPNLNDLILIDDGSESETAEFIKRFADVHGAILIRNDQAKGHPTGATQGLQRSTADFVIVLNADTLPTDGWADKMLACANSDRRIGIVGCLSSTASWQSVPRVFDEDGDWALNPIPDDLTLAQFASLLEQCTARLYPRLPFINGFCFGIKRSLMDHIGLFDYETFPHYGEENDYCLRAGKQKWYGAVADNAFVYHKQGKGYTNEKRRIYAKRADENLIAKHDAERISKLAGACRTSLKMAGLRAFSVAAMDRFRTIRDGVRRFGGRHVSFILPAVDGGGTAVVVQEALAMAKMGVIVDIYNLSGHREGFLAANRLVNSTIRCRFYDTPDQIVDALSRSADAIDAVICTHHTTPHWLAGTHLSDAGIQIGYYIQDYEPWFFAPGSRAHDYAVASYTVSPGIKAITKSQWNRSMLKNHLSLDATVVGPSVDLDLFRPVQEKSNFKTIDKVVVCAMVRPQTTRRAPEMTYKVLRTVADHFPEQADVYSFGCTSQELRDCVGAPSEHVTHLGILNRHQMAIVMGECDIFLDASEFQAMGLTSLEAMASGCAVVVPQNGGAVEFAKDKINAAVVDSSDYVAMVDTIANMIYRPDYREQLQLNAIKEAWQYFPERAAAIILSTLFDETVRGINA